MIINNLMQLNNFSNYEIDIDNGTIFSYKSNSIIGHLNNDGYMCTTIYDDTGERKTVRHHRLIWEVVNGEIPYGYDIHHIDENRSNNSISNLLLVETSTHKHNHFTGENNPMYGKSNPYIKTLCDNNKKAVACYTLEGELVKIYNSVKATLLDGFTPANVVHCCKGKYLTHKGYKWEYMG